MGKRAARQILCGILAASVFTCNAFAISTSAASAVLIEQESGRVLYTQNADEERLIASITKIMTAVVAIEHGDLRAEYTVTWDDMAEGSSMYLEEPSAMSSQVTWRRAPPCTWPRGTC